MNIILWYKEKNIYPSSLRDRQWQTAASLSHLIVFIKNWTCEVGRAYLQLSLVPSIVSGRRELMEWQWLRIALPKAFFFCILLSRFRVLLMVTSCISLRNLADFDNFLHKFDVFSKKKWHVKWIKHVLTFPNHICSSKTGQNWQRNIGYKKVQIYFWHPCNWVSLLTRGPGVKH